MELRESHRDDEAHRLMELLDACHRVLSHLGDRQDTIAQAIQETCREVEARLAELGVPYMETRDHQSWRRRRGRTKWCPPSVRLA